MIYVRILTIGLIVYLSIKTSFNDGNWSYLDKSLNYISYVLILVLCFVNIKDEINKWKSKRKTKD